MPDYLNAMPVADFIHLFGDDLYEALPSEAIVEWGGSHFILSNYVPAED